MLLDTAGLEILDREQCLELAATVPIGRIVFTSRALPVIQPVNFVVERDGVVFRTGAGSKLTAAVRGAVVAFEVDEFDSRRQTGWSVTITGHALLVTDPDEVARLEVDGPEPWVAEERPHFIRIVPELVAGRRVLKRATLGRREGRGEGDAPQQPGAAVVGGSHVELAPKRRGPLSKVAQSAASPAFGDADPVVGHT